MNGAQSLIRTLVNNGVDVCFTNPGTSEMHFVAALDHVPEMRGVLGLFEGVVTGAADGYGRMADKPACTLLHLGPGLGNGIANLHNGRRAQTPIVNIVGEHATYHRHLDAPLTSDIEGLAKPVSKWVRVSSSADDVATDGAEAVAAAMGAPGGVATLILPANTAWNDASGAVEALAQTAASLAAPDQVRAAAKAIEKAKRAVILMSGKALRTGGLEAAARIAAKTGAEIWCDTFNGRIERGAGRVTIGRLPYFAEMVDETLEGVDQLILAGTKPPVAFFAYPGRSSILTPQGVEPVVLARDSEDLIQALEALADEVAAPAIDKLEVDPRAVSEVPGLPAAGDLTAGTAGQSIAALMPENAIVSDESATSGLASYALMENAAPHDWLFLTGGSIGQGMPVATGAAVACPDRKVVCLHGDGGAMYTVQALWTQAREKLDVTTVIFANRSYAILQVELMRVGAENPGPRALSLFDLTNPTLKWTEIASGMGVEAMQSNTAEEFSDHFKYCMNNKGPHLIEVVL